MDKVAGCLSKAYERREDQCQADAALHSCRHQGTSSLSASQGIDCLHTQLMAQMYDVEPNATPG